MIEKAANVERKSLEDRKPGQLLLTATLKR